MNQNLNLSNQIYQMLAQESMAYLKPSLELLVSELKKAFSIEKEILKPDEVCEMLTITNPTLDKRVKKGIFSRYSFDDGRGVYFKRSEIISALKKVN
ncbi:helix-turn-helix transcriptional regulator [Rufibacter tibetensis]|uniref:Helix-turn-helix domain-containing protein n=1 Tax=Rufibacter tibetensis TaxID=512763 RepID=A0A0P0CPF2_9BACT|nr:hypothetical protein [Rufibacter tibetensis]ALI99158.1 hypothetical protein DC20_09445 [Rufibacter tibetensis]